MCSTCIVHTCLIGMILRSAKRHSPHKDADTVRDGFRGHALTKFPS
jgi:hypothetical protein